MLNLTLLRLGLLSTQLSLDITLLYYAAPVSATYSHFHLRLSSF